MAQIDKLFNKLIECNASDLHLEQGQLPKLRLHGELKGIENQNELTENELVDMMKEIVEDNTWQEFQQKGDLDFAYALGEDARFRANYFRHFYGYGAVFRIIPSKILTLDELQMPDVLKTLGALRSGLVLVTGPTGSGKSTTLAALIDYINSTSIKKIVTIEEPVEFMHKNDKCLITHREVGLDTKSFATGLKGALKSDANVILVGEMRDQATIELALTAAQMGILVFGTLHTNSAAKTIDRIIDVFPSKRKNQMRASLANSLEAVVSQQLLKNLDASSRHVAYEILLKTPALPAMIRSGDTSKIISEIQLNAQMGMVLMDNCLKSLVNEGKVSKEEAYMKALDKASFLTGVQ